jgi:hypothetical protein
VGFSLGYAKAMHDSEDIRALLAQAVDLLQEQQRKSEEAVDGTATETPEGETHE